MVRRFAVVIERDKKSFIASVPQLPGCRTSSKTFGRLIKNAEKAIRFYLKTEKDIPGSAFVGIHMAKANYAKRLAVAIEKSDKYYIASVPSLPGCFTQARTINSLIHYIREVVKLCLDTGAKPAKVDFVGVWIIEV